MSAVDVSVVIPSARRVRLAFALEALAAQSIDRARFEVIVVSQNDLGASAAPLGLDVRWLGGSGGRNIAALRNIGWRAAQAPLVAFTDDDCRPAAGWLESMLAAYPGGELIVQGRTEPDPDERHLLHGLARSQSIPGPSGWYETCNMLYPRAMIEQLGGFDESFAALGEDADLGFRAREAGAGFEFASGAVVRHGVIPRSLPAAIRESARRDTIAALIARHPAERRLLYRRWFWKRDHLGIVLAATGAATSRRHRVIALAAALPYLAASLSIEDFAKPRRIARKLLGLGPRAAVDLVEVASTLRGAARARTLVV